MATYYVDYVGGADTNNGTSIVTPWKRCPGDANATDVPAGVTLVAGDTVVFKGGMTYSSCKISLNGSGTAGSRIMLISGDRHSTPWGTGAAVLSASGLAYADNTGAPIHIGVRNYITVDGFTLTGTPTGNYMGAVYVDDPGTGLIVQNCTIGSGSSGMYLYGAWTHGASPISTVTFQNNTVTGCYQEGVLVRGDCDTITLADNVIHDNGGSGLSDGIQLIAAGGGGYPSNVAIRGNTIYNHAEKGPCIVEGATILIEDNYFYGTANIGCTVASETVATTAVTIRNNLMILSPTLQGVVRINGVSGGNITGVDVYNNTLIGNGGGFTIWVEQTGAITVNNVVIKNNLIHTDSNTAVAVRTENASCTSGFDSDYNHFVYGTMANPFTWQGGATTLAAWQALGFDDFVHTQNTDPALGGTYKPAASSPLVDAGTDLTATGFTDDKSGVARGAAWDIGCYEYVAAGNSAARAIALGII